MKKVLIITYYWPPSGGSGVQRWLKFSKYLPEYGWQPIIYTPENSDFALKYGDDNDIPEVKVVRTKIFDPGSLFAKSGGGFKVGEVKRESAGLLGKLAIWFRANVFVPDSKVFWVRKSVSFLTGYLTENKIDLIVTTGPPHSMHLIGLGVKARTGVPWVADFRDPWSDGDILDQIGTSKKSMRSHLQLEKSVLEKASLVVAVTKSMGKSLAKKGEKINTAIITNGFDEEDFAPVAQENGYFDLTYSGLLYGKRNPNELWLALEELLVEDEKLQKKLRIRIAGVLEESVSEQLNNLKHVSKCLDVLGYVSHKESIAACQQASVLILTVDGTKNGNMLIPGKLFEYLACNVPIIGFGESGCDAGNILTECGHDEIITYQDRETTRSRVRRYFELWKSGELKSRQYSHLNYSRMVLTATMADEFNKLVQ